MLCVLLLLQAVALTMALVFEKKVSPTRPSATAACTPGADRPPPPCLHQTSALFQSSIREGIKHYYDDLDFKNILDYVQQKVTGAKR